MHLSNGQLDPKVYIYEPPHVLQAACATFLCCALLSKLGSHLSIPLGL